jgi:predicted DNA-binding protein (MmcQ/YjbR family)
MTAKEVRTIVMSLPEAEEKPHFERTSFRVGNKIFATMTANGTEAMVTVKPRERLYALIKEHPNAFFSYGGWTERKCSALLQGADW